MAKNLGGVVAYGVMMIIFSSLVVFINIATLLVYNLVPDIRAQIPGSAIFQMVISGISLLLGLVGILIGILLLKLSETGRVLMVVLGIVVICLGIFTMIMNTVMMGLGGLMGIIGVIINAVFFGLAISYLSKPEVKSNFN